MWAFWIIMLFMNCSLGLMCMLSSSKWLQFYLFVGFFFLFMQFYCGFSLYLLCPMNLLNALHSKVTHRHFPLYSIRIRKMRPLKLWIGTYSKRPLNSTIGFDFEFDFDCMHEPHTKIRCSVSEVGGCFNRNPIIASTAKQNRHLLNTIWWFVSHYLVEFGWLWCFFVLC